VKAGYGDQIAIIHDSPLTSIIEKLSYKQLLEEVTPFFLKYVTLIRSFFPKI
jgi:hypothetical protein